MSNEFNILFFLDLLQFFSLIHLIRNSSPPLSSNSSLTNRSTKSSNTSVYAQLSVVCGRRLFFPRKGRLALRDGTVIGHPIQHRYNITTILLQLRLQEKSLLPDMLIWIHYDEAFELYGLQNSLHNDYFMYSLPTLTGFWFPILIQQWITYQGVGEIRSCSLSAVYRLHMRV